MKFSVVIVNYASWPFTVRCIEYLYATKYPDFEVVVVDNDNLQPPELPSDTRLIRNPNNRGFAPACNQGIAASTGEYVVLVNPDTVVDAEFFVQMEAFFDSVPKAGAAGPKVMDGVGNLQLSARKDVTLISGLLGRTSLLTRLFPRSALVRSQFPAIAESDNPVVVDWVAGACMVIRRATLDRIGLLDEQFFMYFEDADLCRRVREAGWLVYYLPQLEVVHLTGGSSRSKPQAIWLLHKSAFLYHRKHGPHGPANIFSAVVLAGLAGRGLVKLGLSLLGR